MIESEDGTVTGSIDVSRLDELDPKTDEARAQVDALKAEAQAGQDQANADAQKLAEQAAAQNPNVDVAEDNRDAQGVPAADQVDDSSTDDGSTDEAATAADGEPESEDRDQLRAEAESLGVQVDRRWGVDRLRQEIDTVKGQ